MKFIWKCKAPAIAETILRKRNKVGDLALQDFNDYYKESVIYTV